MRSLVRTIQSNHGIITEKDFSNYRPRIRQPLMTTYRGRTVIAPPPPTSGSILINILNILEGYDLWTDGPAPLSLHRMIEAFKWGFARRTALGDPQFVGIRSFTGGIRLAYLVE
ncbi:Glutathione hydrolase 7, partial [Spiromyces aspiralis]